LSHPVPFVQGDAEETQWAFVPATDLLLLVGEGLVGCAAEGFAVQADEGHTRRNGRRILPQKLLQMLEFLMGLKNRISTAAMQKRNLQGKTKTLRFGSETLTYGQKPWGVAVGSEKY
jgi:hypothetical protein